MHVSRMSKAFWFSFLFLSLFVFFAARSQAATINGAFEFSAAKYSVGEGAGKVDVTIKRVGGSTGAVTVQWRTNGVTAAFNQDYTSFGWTTLSFAAGQTQLTRSISIIDDKLIEPDETFKIALANPTGGASLGTITSSEVSIVDNDAADTTLPTAAITSPASGTTYTSAQVVNIAASAQDNIGVAKVELYDGATLVGTDTTAPYGFAWSITSAGNGTHSFTAKAYDAAGNSVISAPVSLNVNIPAPVVSAPGSFELSASSYSVDEGAGKVDVTIKRVGGSTGAATVQWRTNSVTATFTQDYTSFSWTTLNFADGQSEITKSITIVDDKLVEAGETFNVNLGNPTGGTKLGTVTSAVVTIKDNDAIAADATAPTVAITTPASGASYTSAQTVSVAVSAQDNVGVSKVELYDGATLVGTDSASPYGFSMNITAAGNGTHSLTAKAYDAAGNSAVSTATAITVNITVNSPPEVVASGPLKVFPGAEGFGTDSKAGRGGQIIKVTNLADSGVGSLRAALQATGPRIIVFEVSGYINLKSQISIANPYVTVAGQTAPSPGICLRNFGITIKSHDVLIQHLAIRPGNPTYVTDGLEILGPSSNIVIDHCSITWGTDENSSTWYDNVTNFTFSNTLIAEGLMGHSMGLLLGAGFDKASLVRNVFAHNNGRNPRIQRGRTHDAYVAMVNNLVYNHYWDAAAISSAYGDNDPVHINSMNNLVLDGPQTRPNEAIYGFDSTAGYTLYTSGDEHRPYQSIYPTGLNHTGSVTIKSAPDFSLSGYTVRKASEILNVLKAGVGSRPADRYPHDQRILDSIGNMNGKWISNPSEVGGYTVMSESYRTFNIPANPNGDDDGDGYTNIEEVLHQMSVQVTVK